MLIKVTEVRQPHSMIHEGKQWDALAIERLIPFNLIRTIYETTIMIDTDRTISCSIIHLLNDPQPITVKEDTSQLYNVINNLFKPSCSCCLDTRKYQI